MKKPNQKLNWNATYPLHALRIIPPSKKWKKKYQNKTYHINPQLFPHETKKIVETTKTYQNQWKV